MQKQRKFRKSEERLWFQAVAALEYCVLCGKHGVQVAHRNFGKGMGIKVSPDQTAALCLECHYAIDNGGMDRDEGRALMDKAIVETHHQMALVGSLIIAP